MIKINDGDWRWILSLATIIGAMYLNNGLWLLLLIPIWSGYKGYDDKY